MLLDDVAFVLHQLLQIQPCHVIGYKIRMAHKGTLVRTPIRNLQYQLEIKKPNEAKYSKVEIENFESQMENLESQAHVESYSQENPSKRLRPDPES